MVWGESVRLKERTWIIWDTTEAWSGRAPPKRPHKGNAWVSLTNFNYYLRLLRDIDFLSSIAAISNTP
jgi:hypothetical protein